MKQITKRLLTILVCMLVVLSLVALVACDNDNDPTDTKKLDHITLNTDNVKTEYTEGDELDYSKLKVTAHYDDETSAIVTGFTVTANELEDGKLTVDSDTATVSYTEDGITKTATYPITVTADDNGGDDYTCQNPCPKCDGCLTENCEHDACEKKCDCEEGGGDDDYTCQNPCPKCGGCLTETCEHDACEKKCDCEEGGGDDDYTCQNPCPKCGGCLTETCEHEDCAEKCTCPEDPCCDNPECDCEDCQGECNCGDKGGEDEEPEEIQFTHTEAYGEGGGFIWFKGLFSSDLIHQGTTTAEVEVTKNGEPITATHINVFAAEVQVQIAGSKYDDVVINFTFKNDGKAVATAKLQYTGIKELILSEEEISIQVEKTGDVSVVRLNGNTELSGKTINWTITEGTEYATIPEDSHGVTVTITAVAEGQAVLTCEIDGITAICTITVTEGEVVEQPPVDVSNDLHEQEHYGDYYLGIRLDNSEIAKQVPSSKDAVEATATMDGEPVDVIVHNVYGDSPKYVQVRLPKDWTHTYVVTLKYKNSAGKVIAIGTYTREGDKSLKLDKSTLNLEVGADPETVTATITGNIVGEIEWIIDGDDKVATIAVSEDKMSVTVTAVAEGDATITAKIGDEYVATCKVFVVGEGQTPTVPTVTNARIMEVYGGDVHVGLLLEASDPLASKYAEIASKMAYVKVNGVKNNDMKDMFAYGAGGDYRVNVYMGGPVQKGVDYTFEICDANGNVLLATVALQWN